MEGRVALVTGGTRGIGGAISRALHASGYTVVASYAENQTKASDFHRDTGIHVMQFDVANPESCSHAIEKISREFGPVEILVNNAGITRDTMMHKMTQEQWTEVIQTNLSGCFHVARYVIEGMRAQGFGRIVNISSVNGITGQLGQTNYAAAKAGILGFTKALAQESAGKGVTVNAIAPGYVETDMVKAMPQDVLDKIVADIPVGRIGRVEDIARAVLFLVAEDADFITGATLNVNGGQLMD